MKNYDVVIFDLDGTLSDSGIGITKCVSYALKKLGVEEENLDNLRHFIGPPLKDQLMKTYNFTEEQAIKGVEAYRERYMPIGIYETSLYKDADILLKTLKEKGKVVALATSKPQPMAEEVLKYLNIEKYFDFVQGADLVGPIQEKTDVLKELLMKINSEKTKMVMIGDTHFDLNGATAVGVDSIAAAYGYEDETSLKQCNPVAVADDVASLITMLTKGE